MENAIEGVGRLVSERRSCMESNAGCSINFPTAVVIVSDKQPRPTTCPFIDSVNPGIPPIATSPANALTSAEYPLINRVSYVRRCLYRLR